MNFKIVLFSIAALSVWGCVPFQKSKVKITSASKNSQVKEMSISSVQIINNQLVVNGNNLDAATTLKVSGISFDESFTIESKSRSQIIANSIRAFSFDVSKVFSLIISNANASATFPIDFSLCNSTLNGIGFNCSVSAMDKDVLSYDANTGAWKPRAATGINYLGAFNASTNPPVPNPTPFPSAGSYYIVSADGMIGATSFVVGDWLISNGSVWQKIGNSTLVSSVFSRTGHVVAQEGDYNLDLLTDVDLTIAPVAGKVLKFDGTHWVAADDSAGGGAASVVTATIADGAVTDAKIGTVSASKITGTINSAQILDGSIVNADINAAAAIDYSKLNIPNTTIPYAKLNIANGDIPYAKLTVANGEIPAAKISGLPAVTTVLATTITDGDTTHAPDGNAVHDALALKMNSSGGALTSAGTITNVPDPVLPLDVSNKQYVDTKLDKTAGGTVVGSVSFDTDVKLKGTTNYVTLKANAATTAYTLTLPTAAGASGDVLTTNGANPAVLSWTTPTSGTSVALTGDIGGTVGANTIGSGKVTLTHLSATGTKDNTTYLRGDNTWAPLGSGVLATPLTSLSLATGTAITASDTVLSGMGKLQKQISDIPAQPAAPTGTADATTYHAGDNTWKSFGSNVRGTTLTGLDATGINYASRTIASTDSALVAFNKMLFTQGDYVSKSSDQTIFGSLKINSTTGFIEVPDPIGVMDAANKQYVDNQITISKSGSLFPANNTILMNACPSGWTDLGETTPGTSGVAFCGNDFCHQCQASTNSTLPSNSIILAENCPAGWTRFEAETDLRSAGIDGVLYSACQVPLTSKIPEGTRVLMNSCPADWRTVGRTPSGEDTEAECPSGTCFSCEVPSSKVSTDSLIAYQIAMPNEGGKSVAIRAGNGGATSGNGGNVMIDSGIAAGSGVAGNIILNGNSGTGKVGIGRTAPVSKLDVNGSVRVGADATACSTTNAGSIRYNSTSVNFEECDGVSWKSKRVSGNLIPANSVVIMGANGTAGLCPTGWTSVGQVTGSDGAVGCGSGGTYCSQCQSPASDSLLPASVSIVSENCPEGWVRSSIGGASANSTIYNGTHVTACRAPSSNSSIPGGMRILMDACPAEWKFVATTDKTGLGSATCPSGACKLCEAPGSSSPTNLLIGGSVANANAYAGIIGAPGAIPSGAGGKALVFGGDATSGTGGEVNIKGGSTDSGAGGLVSISGGNSQAGGSGGNVNITSGVAPVAGNGGTLFIRTGAGGTTSGSAGSLAVAVGATTSGTGGSIAMTAGHSINGDAGVFNIVGGNGGTNGNGGDINITSGILAGTGVNGKILLNATNAGLVGIGTSSPNTKLDVTGVVNASGGYTTVSDIRLKTNIVYLDSHNSLERILTLRGIFYDWKDQKQYGKSRQLGLIAQDVKKAFPNAIRENLNGILTVNYSSLIAPIIESIKEIRNWLVGHDEEIAALKTENVSIKNENALIKSYLCSKDPEAIFCK